MAGSSTPRPVCIPVGYAPRIDPSEFLAVAALARDERLLPTALPGRAVRA
ncbi:hypothetical protein [Microtetraspora fusca]|uniref:Uncharacterized protein n=1 Tax=Microtetraspora fusca TaxID=1997 RepID=A0ABW6VJD4_MICFU|nr:hypothetical protein [Microtetraspora fusca]